MTQDNSSAQLVERLRRKEPRFPAMGGGSIGTDANGKVTTTSYITDDGMRLVNPDGPEAADLIEALTRVQPSTGLDMGAQREALVALADAADKCSEAPHFIVQPFLGVYREHGETIAQARAQRETAQND